MSKLPKLPEDSVSVRALRGRPRHRHVPRRWTEVVHAVLFPRGVAKLADEAPLRNGGGEVEVVRRLFDDNGVAREGAISCFEGIALACSPRHLDVPLKTA